MEKAANQGLVDAQVALAAMYDRGLGVTSDRDKTAMVRKGRGPGPWYFFGHSGQNDAAKGSVQFNYQAMRLSASRSIPGEYAKKFLITQ